MTCVNCDEDVRVIYDGDGVEKFYSFPFDYYEQSEVHVSLYDEDLLQWVEVPTSEWSFSTPTTIEFVTPPDKQFKIYRCTPVDPLRAVFHPGHPIRAQDLNDNFDQLSNAIEEAKCQGEDLAEHVEDNYWNNKTDTIKCGDEWIGDDEHIATNCATDARYWNKAEDTTFIRDPWDDEADDRHVPTTGAVDKFVKEQVQDLADNIADAIDQSLINSEDERQGRWNRIYNDDQHLITALAASQRFDVALSEDSPDPDVWIEPGKLWINNDDQNLYYWNGSVWVQPIAGASGGSGIPDAPQDGETYGRKDGQWEVVNTFTTGNIAVQDQTPLTRTESGGQVTIGFDIAQLSNVTSAAKSSFNS